MLRQIKQSSRAILDHLRNPKMFNEKMAEFKEDFLEVESNSKEILGSKLMIEELLSFNHESLIKQLLS